MPVCRNCWARTDGPPCPHCGFAGGERPRRRVPTAGLALERANVAVLAPRSAPPPVRGAPTGLEAAWTHQGPDAVRGTVSRIDGPFMEPARRNPWKWACGALAAVVVLPLWVVMRLVGLSVRIALWLLGVRGHGGPRHSLIDEVLFNRWLQMIIDPPPDIPVYHHTVDTDHGPVGVRQEGEFVAGRVYTNHRTEFRGTWQDGVLIATEGRDHDRGTLLNHRYDPWPLIFWGMFTGIAIALGLLALSGLAAAGSAPPLGSTFSALRGGR